MWHIQVVIYWCFGSVCHSHLQESCLTLLDPWRQDWQASWNTGKQLPIFAMQHPSRPKASTTPWRKPCISRILCHFLPLIQSTYRQKWISGLKLYNKQTHMKWKQIVFKYRTIITLYIPQYGRQPIKFKVPPSFEMSRTLIQWSNPLHNYCGNLKCNNCNWNIHSPRLWFIIKKTLKKYHP